MGTRALFSTKIVPSYFGTFSASGTTSLRPTSSSNRLFSSSDIQASYDTVAFVTPYTLTPSTTLKAFFQNWGFSSTGWTAGYSSQTIREASCFLTSGSTLIGLVPVYFGGVRSKAMAINDQLVYHDEITPADFGLGSWPSNAIIWYKGIIEMPAVNTRIFTHSHRSSGEATGQPYSFQFAWFNRATTTVSSTDVAGSYTAVYGSLLSRPTTYGPTVVGMADTSLPCLFTVGDSTTAGLTDTVTSMAGGGYMNRIAYGAGGTDIIPMINLAVGGTNSDRYIGNSYIQNILNEFVDSGSYGGWAHAANDIGTSGVTTLSTQQTRFANGMAMFTTAGISDINNKFVVDPIARTTSTDSWATTANQTYATGWGVGGVADQQDSWQDTQVGVQWGHVLSTSAGRDPTEQRKWIVNGTAGWATGDGLHGKQPFNSAVYTDQNTSFRTFIGV
jgi:hypothetical protein